MNSILAIRQRLGVTQTSLAKTLGVTQSNVAHYEKGQTVPPDVAKKLIGAARSMGHNISYEDVYGTPVLPEQGTDKGPYRRRQGDKASA